MRTRLRDLARQRWRTTLTVAGIAIGIFALVVFGSLAEHFRVVVAESEEYVKGTVRLATKTNDEGETPGLSDEDVAVARSVPGVAAVVTTIALLFDGLHLDDDPLLFLSPKAIVEGLPPEHAARMRPGVRVREGRWLAQGDHHECMVVRWLAEARHLALGDQVRIRHRPYEIVGIYEAPDFPMIPAGIAPFDDLRRGMENASLVHARKFFAAIGGENSLGSLGADQLARLAEKFVSAQEERWYPHEVIPDDPARVPEIADALREKLPHVSVIEPQKLAQAMEKSVAVLLAITALVSVISSIVGGLLIVNTMAMAVLERRREIAIKVAVGASPRQVAFEFVLEAAVMGLAGALLGCAVGVVAILVLDPWIVSRVEVGASFFAITPGLLLGVVGYGVGLGVLAGLVPALRAARTDPAAGLREL